MEGMRWDTVHARASLIIPGRSSLIRILFGLAPWLGVACGTSAHEPPPGCESDGQYNRTISLDDNALGYSALDVLATFAANGAGRLHWFDGTETVIHITADASHGTVDVNAPPADPKFCAPSMSIGNITFAVLTDDGRFAESVVSTLTAIGRGAPTAVWPDLAVSMDKIQGTLLLPTDWTSGYELESVKLIVNSKIDTASPFCRPDEKPDLSTTSTSECTSWAGKLVQWGDHLNDDPQRSVTTVNHVVGWWSWL